MSHSMHQLNTLESMFVYLDQHGAGMAQLMLQVFSSREKPDIEQRYKHIVARVRKAVPHIRLLHEKVYRVPGDTDKPYWVVEKDVDLDYHIRHLALPPPGNWNQLTQLYEQLAALPLDLEMPLWRIYIIEGLNSIEGLPKDSFAVITKTHHAGADGVTVTQLTNVIAGARMSTPAVEDDDENYVPGIYEVIGRAVSNNVGSSLKLGRELLIAAPAIGKWALAALADSVVYRGEKKQKLAVPVSRFNGLISPDRVFDIAIFKRKEINEIRSKLEERITINDVGLTICGGALREYLLKKRELPDDSLVAAMPISIRTDEVGGNQFSMARISLCTHLKSHGYAASVPIPRIPSSSSSR
jgi:diacylglycerol O-acyltransferase / wax synthase